MKKIIISHTAYNPPFLVSACLCGISCRYDGKSSEAGLLAELYKKGLALAICPEVDGGLGIPRPPCELLAGRAVTRDGRDFTENFKAGAARALELARNNGVSLAILKEKSPSCGVNVVYDGSFSGVLIPGQGLLAGLLRRHGIFVAGDQDLPADLPPACSKGVRL